MTQLNTPYPATAFLSGFLRERGHEVVQADLALELALKIFSAEGLRRIAEELKGGRGSVVRAFLREKQTYVRVIDPVLRFLQGKDPSLAYQIINGRFLPEGRRLAALQQESLTWALGSQSVQDLAKHLASLFLDEIADVIRAGVDNRFGLAKYGEKLAESTASFEPLHKELQKAAKAKGTLIDEFLEELVLASVKTFHPEWVGVTAPFTGNAYGAFRVAQILKKFDPSLKMILGGGYVNTELRDLSEPRVFDYFDYVTLDDGELPFLQIVDANSGSVNSGLLRTYVREGGKVRFIPGKEAERLKSEALPAPSYRGLKLDSYLSFVEVLNPMHRLWSDGRWNKLMLAHGCYWKKCAFCDTSLDYISRYEPSAARQVVDRMETLIAETGQTGFHFVDEAAPPALLKAIAREILHRKLVVTWWGNIRFEKAFTPELASLLARSGCVAVSGGLEAASDRLLKLMRKGVTVEQVAQVTHGFASAGIMVHAYLIYGFPSQTVQETIDSLERVRQLFEVGCLHSAFWHQFSATVHSPIGRNPAEYGIRIQAEVLKTRAVFARNDLKFTDLKGCTPKQKQVLGKGLEKAVFNYMHGAGFDLPLNIWFQGKVPKTTLSGSEIRGVLSIST
ncbi:MAG TPA: radical SAM protein [Bdellovibrionales bacterium]|nr:radical SAM protein [Bdellovibrionales bacterium]